MICQTYTSTTVFSIQLHEHLQVTHPLLSHRLVVGRSPVDIEALQQLMRDDKGLSLGVAGNTDALPILLGSLAPVPIPKARITLIQQVTHQLSQKRLWVNLKEMIKKDKRG